MPGKQYQFRMSVTEDAKDSNPNDWTRIQSLQQRIELLRQQGEQTQLLLQQHRQHGHVVGSVQFHGSTDPQYRTAGENDLLCLGAHGARGGIRVPRFAAALKQLMPASSSEADAQRGAMVHRASLRVGLVKGANRTVTSSATSLLMPLEKTKKPRPLEDAAFFIPQGDGWPDPVGRTLVTRHLYATSSRARRSRRPPGDNRVVRKPGPIGVPCYGDVRLR